MSWHCGYCGSSDHVTGLIYIFDIRGGIPITFCVHLKCLAKTFDDEELREEILSLDDEEQAKADDASDEEAHEKQEREKI